MYTLTVCSLSGLFLILLRRLRAGIRAIDLVALLSGCMTFRAMAELSHGFVETLSKSYPDILGTLAVAYVMVVAALSALLVFAVVLGRRSLQASPPSARGPRPSLAGVPGSDQLTDRERQALIDTLAGHTGKRIAEERGLAESTVGTYRRRGYEKLGVSTKRELMRGRCTCGEGRGRAVRLVPASLPWHGGSSCRPGLPVRVPSACLCAA